MLNFGSEHLAFSGSSTFGILYNLFCILFVLLIWYPASHSVKEMVEDENLAQTWYVFWILPVLVIGLNLALIPKYNTILAHAAFSAWIHCDCLCSSTHPCIILLDVFNDG